MPLNHFHNFLGSPMLLEHTSSVVKALLASSGCSCMFCQFLLLECGRVQHSPPGCLIIQGHQGDAMLLRIASISMALYSAHDVACRSVPWPSLSGDIQAVASPFMLFGKMCSNLKHSCMLMVLERLIIIIASNFLRLELILLIAITVQNLLAFDSLLPLLLLGHTCTLHLDPVLLDLFSRLLLQHLDVSSVSTFHISAMPLSIGTSVLTHPHSTTYVRTYTLSAGIP